MSWFESVSFKSPKADPKASAFDAQQAALLQLGAMSPLWMLFFSASAAGMAYWSMTRWMALGAPEKVAAAPVRLRLVPPVPKPVAVPEPEAAPALKTPDSEIALPEVPVPDASVLQASTPAIVTLEPDAPTAAPEPVLVAPVAEAAPAAKPVEAPPRAQADLGEPSTPPARKPRGRKPAPKA